MWRLELGAQVIPEGVRFKVWAPKPRHVEVVLEDTEQAVAMERDSHGYFAAAVSDAKPGMRYRYRLDGTALCPDPCSRYQPEGPHGPSLIVDPSSYRWHDGGWPGVRMRGQVIYELHVGTFTRAGTFDSAIEELAGLKRLGVTLIELMPVAEFPGRWNWGYDGVGLYAPAHVYGDPESLKRFVDAAHATGLGVILDVVYNHVGPDGNYFTAYSDDYFTDRYQNDWGSAINFDGPQSTGVRELFVQNACYWVAEYHCDGLRLDATQDIHDAGPEHVLAELSRRARAASPRPIVLIAESEPQDIRLVTPVEHGGFGLDALWGDDYHHAARVALTGRREAYYTDYRGAAQEFVSAVKRGILYQGQRYVWQSQPRGSVVAGEPAHAFVFYLQNHDQVANALHGDRIHAMADPARYRALMALTLLAPETPMLFMGQEFGAGSPFLFFADHHSRLAPLIHRGRKEFLSQFPSYASPEAQDALLDPSQESAFVRSKLDGDARGRHGGLYRFHQDLLRLRREDPVIAAQDRRRLDGAVLSRDAFILRYFGHDGDDRLLAINLGADLDYSPAPEPLLAPVVAGRWILVWSSDHPDYGGPGIINPCTEQGWRIPAATATLFRTSKLLDPSI